MRNPAIIVLITVLLIGPMLQCAASNSDKPEGKTESVEVIIDSGFCALRIEGGSLTEAVWPQCHIMTDDMRRYEISNLNAGEYVFICDPVLTDGFPPDCVAYSNVWVGQKTSVCHLSVPTNNVTVFVDFGSSNIPMFGPSMVVARVEKILSDGKVDPIYRQWLPLQQKAKSNSFWSGGLSFAEEGLFRFTFVKRGTGAICWSDYFSTDIAITKTNLLEGKATLRSWEAVVNPAGSDREAVGSLKN